MKFAHRGLRAAGALALYLAVAAALANVGPYAEVGRAGGRLRPPDERPRISLGLFALSVVSLVGLTLVALMHGSRTARSDP